MDRLKKNLRCKFFLGFVVIVLFLFLFFSLMDTTLRFNHYIKYLAVKTKEKGPWGCFPSSPSDASLSRMPISDRSSSVRLFLLLSSLEKLILMISAHALNRKQ